MFRSTSSVLDSAISETLGSGNAPILGWKAVWKRRSTRRDICGPRYLKPWQSPKSLRLARLGEQVLRDVVGSVLSSSHRVLTREGRLYGLTRDLGFGGRSTGKGYRTSIVLYASVSYTYRESNGSACATSKRNEQTVALLWVYSSYPPIDATHSLATLRVDP